ncbi:MAG: hypothetical protein ACXWV9_03875 [Flavisolibacter sp.]
MQYKSTVHVMFHTFIIIMTFFACTSPNVQKDTGKNKKLNVKPPSSYQDTLRITTSSAVFYRPDSMQLEKIRQLTEKQVFDGSMHEYFYQQKNAYLFFQKHWPQLTIVEAKNIRYLLFVRSDKSPEIIDLDKMNDAYGIFAFASTRSPLQIDMTNVETQVTRYFKNN